MLAALILLNFLPHRHIRACCLFPAGRFAWAGGGTRPQRHGRRLLDRPHTGNQPRVPPIRRGDRLRHGRRNPTRSEGLPPARRPSYHQLRHLIQLNAAGAGCIGRLAVADRRAGKRADGFIQDHDHARRVSPDYGARRLPDHHTTSSASRGGKGGGLGLHGRRCSRHGK